MAENTNPPAEPMSDDAIAGMVQFIEAAEVFAKAMDMTVSRAALTMLKTMQAIAAMQHKQSFAASWNSMLPSSEKIS